MTYNSIHTYEERRKTVPNDRMKKGDNDWLK
jgi:hypothetical protein